MRMGLFNGGARRAPKKHINADTPLAVETKAEGGKKTERSNGAGKRKAEQSAPHKNKPKSGKSADSLQSSTETKKTAQSAPPEKAAERPETTTERLSSKPTAFDKTAREPAAKKSTEEAEAAEKTELAYLAEALRSHSRLAATCRYYRPFLAAGAMCALCALLLLAPLVSLYCAEGFCYIYEDGALEGVAVANADDPAAAFAKAGLELGAADEVDTELLGSTAYMSVRRAHDITVIADGRTYEHSVLGKNAREALAELGISVGEDDRVTPEGGAPLKNGDVVRVKRVTYQYRDVTETVPWETVTKLSPLIDDGETLVMDEGEQRDGAAFRTYRDTYVDGELEQSETVKEVYDKYPWDLVYLEGKGDAPMSPLDGAKYTDIKIVNNAPAEYERVMENSVCTAYSFNPGTWGASGMYLIQGFVAVDTSEIPYGSLLYITSPTGNFTYGWAVAADVGEAMVAGYVDIDLFFETYRESALFGKHRMNVYVVKQLTQSELEEYIANEGMFRKRVPE